MAETFDVQKATEAQEKYCNEKGYPHFAPHSGICFSCHQNIYRQYTPGRAQIRNICRKSRVNFDYGLPALLPDILRLMGLMEA